MKISKFSTKPPAPSFHSVKWYRKSLNSDVSHQLLLCIFTKFFEGQTTNNKGEMHYFTNRLDKFAIFDYILAIS